MFLFSQPCLQSMPRASDGDHRAAHHGQRKHPPRPADIHCAAVMATAIAAVVSGPAFSRAGRRSGQSTCGGFASGWRGCRAASTGCTIVQTDGLHVGPTIGREFIDDIVRRTNALRAGHHRDHRRPGRRQRGAAARRGRAAGQPARAPRGLLRHRQSRIFLGRGSLAAKSLGVWAFACLRNERVSIGEGEASFDLGRASTTTGRYGTGDCRRGGADARSRGRDTEARARAAGAPAALDARGRALRRRAAAVRAHARRPDLAVQVPGAAAAAASWPGLHRHGEAQIYVSRGTGYWGPPMRLGRARRDHATSRWKAGPG